MVVIALLLFTYRVFIVRHGWRVYKHMKLLLNLLKSIFYFRVPRISCQDVSSGQGAAPCAAPWLPSDQHAVPPPTPAGPPAAPAPAPWAPAPWAWPEWWWADQGRDVGPGGGQEPGAAQYCVHCTRPLRCNIITRSFYQLQNLPC